MSMKAKGLELGQNNSLKNSFSSFVYDLWLMKSLNLISSYQNSHHWTQFLDTKIHIIEPNF
jgi:hypothetical protein